ncbi:MAG: glucokinase [Microbacteriaceae bacterium]|nr:sugar kinase [Leifsonia sp.]MDQ1579267.1 glucokinase [Microbacteriaceae bacterium]MDQ1587277.1 glucokinase [Microbacteriaceae bacterium]HEV7567150.1 ROK family protein [Microbacteriaceae bacterium]
MTLDSTLAHTQLLGAGGAVIAFDVGGTDTKSALFDETGRMLGLTRTPTPHRGADTATAVLEHVQELTLQKAREFPAVRPVAAGLIVPGLVDDDRGIGIHATNLNWSDVPFKQLVEARLGIPASFSHDVRAAGQAEHRLGAARPYNDVVVMVIGTGIASALFIDGRPYIAGGYAGEIGHSVVDPAGPLCSCGAHGCLESIGSAGAIARRYQERTGIKPSGAKEVLELAKDGDVAAGEVWSDALNALALSIAQLTAVLAPQAVVIGGGLAQAGDALFVPLRERVDALLSFHRRPELVPASIGENAGLFGAALRARDLVGDAGSSS